MSSFSIEPYRSECDRQAIIDMLTPEQFYLQIFLFREKQNADIVWTARSNGTIVGVISHAGRYRRVGFLIYVLPEYRCKGIGTQLFKKADEYYSGNDWTEHVFCEFPDEGSYSERFLKKQGFNKFCSSNIYERTGDLLPESNFVIRTYTDEDFSQCRDIDAAAFWILRHNMGLTPEFYTIADNTTRKFWAENSTDRFLLTVDSRVMGMASVFGNELRVLCVRPDMWGNGYGHAVASYAVNELIKRGNKTVTLSCIIGNPAARLYESLGFYVSGTLHSYRKYYLPESRPASPSGLVTPEAVINEFKTYGKMRVNENA